MTIDAGAGSVSFASGESDANDLFDDVDVEAEEVKVPSDDVDLTKGRAKRPKRVKRPKAKKPKGADSRDEEFAMPAQVNIDFYRGINKGNEAEQLARAFIEKNYDAPNASYVYVQKWRDGFVVEMQEGGGQAYLPEVLAKLDEDSDAIVAVPMSGRILQVRIDKETDNLEAVLLATSQEPPPEAFIAVPTVKMSAFDRRGSKVFVTGVGLLAASTIGLAFAAFGLFVDTEAWALPYIEQTAVADLPSAQAGKLTQAIGDADCIAKMEYRQGNWNIQRGWDDGSGRCSSSAIPAVDPDVTPNSVEGNAPMLGADPAPAPGQINVPTPPTPGGF